MGSPATLNIAELVLPIPGPNPAGLELSSVDEKEKLRDFAESFDLDDATVPKQKLAKFDTLIENAQKLLKTNGKDRRTVFELVRALATRHHFAGLRDGLMLVEQFCLNCWDFMHPGMDVKDPDDIAARSFAFAAVLNDEQSRQPFPYFVRSLPLFQAGSTIVTKLSLQTDGTAGATPKIPYETFKQLSLALSDEGRAKLQTTVDDLKDCVTAVKQLEETLSAQVAASVVKGGYITEAELKELKTQNKPTSNIMTAERVQKEATVGFGSLKQAIEECLRLAEEALSANATATPSSEAPDAATSGGGAATVVAAARTLTRDGIYNQLKDLADKLATLEPHSPVPFFLRRVLEMRDRTFPDLVDKIGTGPILEFLRAPLPEPKND